MICIKLYKSSLINIAMKNIVEHAVNIPSKIVIKNWDIFKKRYTHIENSIDSSQKSFDYLLKNIHSTGAFQMSIKDFNKNKHSEIAKYFFQDKRSIKLKTKILLRGAYYFPAMLKNLSPEQKIDIIVKDLLMLKTLLSYEQSNLNLIIFLATLDNLKNYLLIVLNAIDQSLKKPEVMSNVGISDNHYQILINSILFVEYYQFKTIVTKKIHWSKEVLSSLNINYIEEFLKQTATYVKSDKYLSENFLRKIRESNDPYKIINFAKNVAENFLPNKTVICSFAYGGIELPFAVNAYRMIVGKSIKAQVIASLSNYSTGSSNFVQDLNDSLPSFYNENYFQDFNSVLILDDSTTTGKTIQTFIDLCPKTITHYYLGIVSFKNTNRYHHLIRPFHGAINPEVLERASISFKSNFANTYKKFSYTNKAGTFDKNKSKIITLLNKFNN